MSHIRALLTSLQMMGGNPVRRVAGAPGIRARPQILTDVSVIIRSDAQTGIQRVVRGVWTNLLALSGNSFDAIPVYASRTHGYRYARPDFLSKPVADRLKGKPVEIEPGDHFLGLDLSAHVLPSHKRQLSAWRSRGATVHLVVYDLLPLRRPDWFTDKAVSRFERWLEVVRDNCDQALCISDQVANDLRELNSSHTSRPKIGRLRLAGDIAGSRPSLGIDKETSAAIAYAMTQPTVLMVGTIEPRKGYDIALAAFEHLWAEGTIGGPSLIIAGKPGWRTEALQAKLREHPELGGRLHWLPNASDEGLSRLFEACRGVLHASYAEGFGLPAIEAAMHNRRALVRDLPVFREQQLPSLVYFEHDEPGHMADRIRFLVEAGPAPAATLPTWAECVHDLIDEMGIVPRPELQAASKLRQAS